MTFHYTTCIKYLADNFDVAELPSDKRLGEVVKHGREVRLVFYHFGEVFHSQRNHFPRRSQLLRSESCRSLILVLKAVSSMFQFGIGQGGCACAPPNLRIIND